MNRRLFLSHVGRTVLAVPTLGMLPFAERAYAIAPAVAIAVAQTAISIVKMFSHAGDSTESLLRLQVEMLRQIEAELTVIEQGIQQILSRLDEIKELIGEIPQKVVIEFDRSAIAGLNLKFAEVSEAYVDGGMTSALSAEVQRDLIAQVQTARNGLMSYPQPQFGLVPMICSACFVESYGMALANTEPARFRAALAAYRRWFVSVSRGQTDASLEGKIKALQAVQFADAKIARDASASPTTTMCFTSGYEQRMSHLVRWEKRCTNDQIATTVAPIQDAAVSKAAGEMIKKKIIQPDEQPLVVTVSPQHSGDFEEFYTGNPVHAIYPPDKCPGTGNSTPCSSIESAATADAAERSRRLTTNGFELMSLHALRDAAEHAIAFIDKIQPRGKPKPA